MLSIRIEGLANLQQSVDGLAQVHVPFATAAALTRTASQAREDTYRQMMQKLRAPTRYTLSSLFIKPATKTNLQSMVYVKDAALISKTGYSPAETLRHLFEGGDRNFTRFEMALKRIGILPQGMAVVPGAAAPLNANGNISPGFYIQMLAYFSAFGEQGYAANMTAKTRARFEKKASKAAGGGDAQYFVSRGPGHWFGGGSWRDGRVQKLAAGIWQRVGFGHGSAVRPVLMFVRKPKYRRYFDLQQIAQDASNRVFAIEFNQAMALALRTAL